MSGFTPRDPDFTRRVSDSFATQSLMATLGASLGSVEPGLVEIAMPLSAGILQQDGFVHGGALATIADSAAGYAALTLTPPGTRILTVEFKLNFLQPARFAQCLAVGRVLRAGRTLTIAQSDVYGADEGGAGRVPLVLLIATLMAIEERRPA